MPIFCYECIYCKHEFEEYLNNGKNSGKSLCPKCGNNAFKIPAIFNTKIFKKRKFADGTETPDHVRTHKQEKDWLKSEGITYDKPTGREGKTFTEKREKKRKSKTAMEIAFKDAVQKTEQGFRIDKKQKEPKRLNFEV